VTGGRGSGGGSSGGNGTAADTTAPTISHYLAIKADATTSSGASVSYSVVATDPDDGTARITVACSPGSGSIFPLGHHRATRTTSVTCNAHDFAGNVAPPMSFSVTVVGVRDQLVALERELKSVRTLTSARRTPLVADLLRADRYTRAGRYGAATAAVGSFMSHPNPLRLPAKTRWIRQAGRLISVLG
jgi:hypothetical protein